MFDIKKKYLLIQEGLRESQPSFQSHYDSDAHRTQSEDSQDHPQSAEPLDHQHRRIRPLDSHQHQHPNQSYEIIDSQALQHQSMLAVLDLLIALAQSHYGGQVPQNSHPIYDPDEQGA